MTRSLSVFDHVQIVADEDIRGEVAGFAELDQEIEDLRLNRFVQSGDRFVEDHSRGFMQARAQC